MDRQLIGRLAIAAIAAAAVTAAIAILGDSPSPAASPAAPTSEVVSYSTVPPSTVHSTPAPGSAPAPGLVYELTGPGTATVVYDENGLGLVHQELSVPLPWRHELRLPPGGTVRLLGQGTGPVTCRVTLGDRELIAAKAEAGEVASCTGRLP